MRVPLIYHVVFCVLCIFPVISICRRAGVNQWVSFLLFIPVVGFLLCGLVLSYANWDIQRKV